MPGTLLLRSSEPGPCTRSPLPLRAWFEELRKKRVAELRQELEKSEDSIGSLESKLESLKAEKGGCSHVDYGCSRTASPAPALKLGLESSGKDTSKDGLSASSFTLPGCQIPPSSVAEMETQPGISESSEQEKFSSIKNLAETSSEQGLTLQKRRGKRKRKDYSRELKEFGERENLGSTNVVATSNSKENSTSNCCPTVRSSSINDHDRGSCGDGNDDLMGIFSSIVANDYALVFRRRLDSQKRARYRKIIRWHVDFDTIRARITSCSIVSIKELFRDMLLLANNAVVFYSKRTREYKTALLLRDFITRAYQQHCANSSIRLASPSPSPIFPLSPMCNPPVKPRSARHYKGKLSKLSHAENIDSGSGTSQGWRRDSRIVGNVVFGTPELWENPSNERVILGNSQVCRKKSIIEPMMGKRSINRFKKVGCGTSKQCPKCPLEDRKRARR